MSNLTIITNNVPRKLLYLYELPKKWQKEYDYVKDDGTPRFTKYKGQWIDPMDSQDIRVSVENRPMGWAMCVDPTHPFAKWDAVSSDSFFSGLLFRFNDDWDTVVVGRYCS